jgi:TonB family protein
MMKNRLFIFLLLSLFAVNVCFAQQELKNKISLDIKGMDIVDVLKMISSRSGMNIIMGKNVTGKVTLFLKNVDLWDAFEIILLANDLAYEKKGDIINVMTQRDYELTHGERFQDKKQAKIIQLKNAKAVDLSRALNQIKTNLGRIVVDEGSNTLALIDTPETIKDMEDFIKTTDLPLQTKVFSLNYAQADKIQPKIQEAITKGVGSIKIDERTNKIAITDYPEKLDEIGKVISAFDEKTPQVLIDAQIVEINPKKDQFAMGVDWDYWIKKNIRLVTSMPAPTLTDISTIPNKFSVGVAAANALVTKDGQYKSVLDLLRVIGETKILSSPRIMTLNNQEAKILVGTKEAYITSTTSQSGTGATITSQSVNFVDVGIKLYVTPTINRDGFVIMKIKPEISSSKRTDITSENQVTQVPIVTTSESETSVMVQDGTTIIIAGLKKDQQVKEVHKIPLLGDIPILGFLFKNQKDDVIKTELVIFITPHIVSGEAPVEYTSSTQNKDIAYIQTLAKAEQKNNGAVGLNAGGYKQMVFDKIKSVSLSNKVSQKGAVELSFTLNSEGLLTGEPKVVSSDNQGLDKIAIESVKNASPFPAFPKEISEKEKSFYISLEYK